MGLPLLLFLAIAAAAASTPKASTGLPAGEFPQAAIAIANQQTDNNLMDTIAAMANTTHKGDIVSFRTLLGNQWRSSAGFAFVPDAYDGSVPLPLLVYFPNVVPANKGSKDKEGSPGEAALSQLDESIGLEDLGAIVLAPQPSHDNKWNGDADTPWLDNLLRDVFNTLAVDEKHIAFGGFGNGASAAVAWGTANRWVTHIMSFSPARNPLDSTYLPNKAPIFVSFGSINNKMLNGYHQMVDGLRQGGFKVEFKEFSDTNNMIPDAVLHAAVKWWLMGGN